MPVLLRAYFARSRTICQRWLSELRTASGFPMTVVRNSEDVIFHQCSAGLYAGLNCDCRFKALIASLFLR
jgi:hypothetical protein